MQLQEQGKNSIYKTVDLGMKSKKRGDLLIYFQPNYSFTNAVPKLLLKLVLLRSSLLCF